MNRLILISTVLLLAFVTNLPAQNQSDKSDQIQIQKIAFLTKKMELTEDEAKRFWPIYNAYIQEKTQLEKEATTKNTLLSDSQAKELLEKKLSNAEKIISVKRDFLEKASKVVSYQKLLQLEKGEREFRIWILNRFRFANSRRG